jgi:hypothetical protein
MTNLGVESGAVTCALNMSEAYPVVSHYRIRSLKNFYSCITVLVTFI